MQSQPYSRVYSPNIPVSNRLYPMQSQHTEDITQYAHSQSAQPYSTGYIHPIPVSNKLYPCSLNHTVQGIFTQCPVSSKLYPMQSQPYSIGYIHPIRRSETGSSQCSLNHTVKGIFTQYAGKSLTDRSYFGVSIFILMVLGCLLGTNSFDYDNCKRKRHFVTMVGKFLSPEEDEMFVERVSYSTQCT
ncbi:hypothetical protein J6590_010779 [Homalodisca vitripennis]|nr:hypothetical protein J6590_010779 [Homalodisca vitripennis]